MAEESASASASAPAELPIIVGVEGSVEFAPRDSSPLRAFFENEITALRHAYPHSPIWLVPRASDALLSVLSSVAEASHVRILGRHDRIIDCGLEAGELDPDGGDCHLLIRVLDDSSPVTPNPQPAPLPISLEARYAVELIEVRLDPDRTNLACSVTRSSLTGGAARWSTKRDASDKALKRTDRFNSDAQTRANRRTDTVPIRPDSGAPGVACARLQRLFASADALSNAYQEKVTRTIQLIFVLATLAAILYGLFLVYGAGNRSLQEYLLAPYLVLLVCAYIVYYLARRVDLHARFVEYRALAEGARVQLYWLICGVDAVVTDSYLAAHALDLHWIRLALRLATPRPTPPPERAAPEPDTTVQALQYWIRREKSYYTRSAARSVRAQKWASALVRVLFIGGGCATLLVLLQFELPLAPFLKRIGLASFLCPSIAAAIVALATKLGVLYRAEHHSRMLDLYTQAERILGQWGPERATELAMALGQAALRESEEWTVFRRDRRIDEPASPFRRPW